MLIVNTSDPTAKKEQPATPVEINVVNAQENQPGTEDEAGEKVKGYKEGTRDDSLTEAGADDSGDQLRFPAEEGK